MISNEDHIRNDVADMKRDLAALFRIVEDIASKIHHIEGLTGEVQETADTTATRLESMEEKFIAMDVIYPDVDNA